MYIVYIIRLTLVPFHIGELNFFHYDLLIHTCTVQVQMKNLYIMIEYILKINDFVRIRIYYM